MAVQGTGGKLSSKILALYDRNLLTRAVDNQLFDMYAQKKMIKKNGNTKSGFAYRYKNILPATTPLAEYDGSNIKAGNKIVREEVEFALAHYGDYIIYTDELDLYDLDNITSSFLDILGDQASLTADTITRDVLRGGTNVIYAGGSISRTAMADASKVIVKADLDLAELKFKTQKAKKLTEVIVGTTAVGTRPVRGGYVGICHASVTVDLRLISGWQDVEDYSKYKEQINMDEVGRYGSFRFTESTNNDPIPDQGTTTDINVYPTLLIAENAYCTVSLRGQKSIETIVKALGDGGTSDPLNQFGTIGWKMKHGAAILNEAWLIRLESTASLEDATAKHYYDYT